MFAKNLKLLINQNVIILASFLILSILAFFLSINFLPQFPNNGDGVDYETVALELLQNHRYIITDGLLRAPLYSFLLTLVFGIFGHTYLPVYLIQFIMLGCISFITFLIAKNFLNLPRNLSLLAAVITFFWPYLLLNSLLVLSDILFVFFCVLFFYQLLRISRHPSALNGILAGAWIGFAALTRPNALLMLPWIAGLALFFYIINGENKIKKIFNYQYLKNKLSTLPKAYFHSIILATVMFIAVISPWIIYASYKTGKFTPIASNLSVVLAGTNSSYNNEWGYYQTPGYEPWAKVTPQKIAFIKIKNFFRFWKSGATGYQADALAEKYSFGKYLLFAYRIEFYAILFLAILSLRYVKQNKTILLFWIIIFYFWSLHTVLHPLPRYRMPINPLIITLACYSLYEIIKNAKIKLGKNAGQTQTKNL